MPRRLTDRATPALILGLFVIIVAILATAWLYREQRRTSEWVAHTLQVSGQLSTLLYNVQAAESSQRGYMLTGQKTFLAPYEKSKRRMERDLTTLSTFVADNPHQRGPAADLRDAIDKRMALLASGIARRGRGEIIADGEYEPGLIAMARVREIIVKLGTEEERLLKSRTRQSQQQAQWVSITLALTASATILFGLFALIALRRRLREAESNSHALAHANERLIAEAHNREAAESQLRQMQKMETIGQLTGGIAHDFNNMLAIVIGSLDMVKRRLTGDVDSRVRQGLDNAAQGAQRAAELTSRLLAFSRQQPLAPQPLEVNRLVSGMSELLRRTIGEQILVETVLSGGLWKAHVDPSQLENAIVNLCVNARDAMAEGGRLTIETANAFLDDAYAAGHIEVVAGQYVMISVSDTGSGMTADVIARAFDPFYTTKGVGKGTGLGLSQVYGFVKQSKGHTKIYSEIGQGSTIKLYLPRYYGKSQAAALDARSADTDPMMVPMAKPGETILVVEDEERVRAMSVASLIDLGYTVLDMVSPNEALAILATDRKVDLLFTDIVMPEMNGRQLAEKAVALRPGLPVLYTTGYTRNAIVHNGMLDAGVQFIPKPFTFSQLATKVRQVLDETPAV